MLLSILMLPEIAAGSWVVHEYLKGFTVLVASHTDIPILTRLYMFQSPEQIHFDSENGSHTARQTKISPLIDTVRGNGVEIGI